MYEVYLKQQALAGRWVPVANSKEAADVVRHFIRTHEFGSSRWEGGQVRRVGERKTAFRVSYNGRVWDARPFPQALPATF